MPKLHLVADAPEMDEPIILDRKQPLRAQIDQIVDEHRTKVIDAVRDWILYWVQLGARQLALDECPSLAMEDREFVIDWLREEGFVVHRPWLWGRVVIDLQVERRRTVTPEYQPERRKAPRTQRSREPRFVREMPGNRRRSG